jgi:hypothetical protein
MDLEPGLCDGQHVGIWKLSTDEPIPRPRIVLSAVVYAIWCAALWTSAGYGIHVGISSAWLDVTATSFA